MVFATSLHHQADVEWASLIILGLLVQVLIAALVRHLLFSKD